MKGTNTMDLNEATMIQAVQEYLDRRFISDCPIVQSVKSCKVGLSDSFTVTVEGSDSNAVGKTEARR